VILMNSVPIKSLEDKIHRAIQLIAGLKDEKLKLEKENESLRAQLEELRVQVEGHKKAIAERPEASSAAHPRFNTRVVKERLEKLAVKLAALEDSWS